MSRLRSRKLLFLFKRILIAILTVFFLLTFAFLAIRVLPGDPALALVPEGADESILSAIRAELGLDLPIHIQYFNYMSSVLSGNLGQSWHYGRIAVFSLVTRALPATIELAAFGVGFGVLFGIIGGAFAAKNKGNYKDYSFRITTLVLYAIPVFVLGPLLQIALGTYLNFPTTGRTSAGAYNQIVTGFVLLDGLLGGNLRLIGDWLSHMITPSLVLGLYLSATLGRISRVEVLMQMNEDHVPVARMKGLSENQVLFKHVFRNALIPIVTAVGFQFAALMGGAIVVESIFNIPGIGNLLVTALRFRDFPLIQGALTFTIIFIAAISVILDIVYTLLDPRLNIEG